MMKSWLWLLLLFVPAELYAKASDRTIDLDRKAVGPITAKTTYQDLVAMKIAMADKVHEEDGKCRDRTIIFPDEPREMIIYWNGSDWYKCQSKHRDPKHRVVILPASTPSFVEINGYKGKSSAWRVSNGIKIGTRLDELEEMFKGSVSFYDFGTDAEKAGVCCEENAQVPRGLELKLEADAIAELKILINPKTGVPYRGEGYSQYYTGESKRKIKVAEIYYRFQ